MSEVFGLGLAETIALAKKVRENREWIGISQKELAKMLGVSLSEVQYLEKFAMIVDQTDEKELQKELDRLKKETVAL